MWTINGILLGIVSYLHIYEHYIIGSPFLIYLDCDQKLSLYLWGRTEQLSHRFFSYQVTITKFQNLKDISTPESNLVFAEILSWKVTVEEYQKYQLKHKKVHRYIEFYEEHGSPLVYRIHHGDNPNDTCNVFYSLHCQQENDNKVLRLHNEGENFTFSSLSNKCPITTIQTATHCFWMDGTINHFWRSCLPSTQSLSSVEGTKPTYSSRNSLNTNEDNDAQDELPDDADEITDDYEHNMIWEINLSADSHRLRKAKAVHDAVRWKTDASLVEKTLIAVEALHLDTKSSTTKLYDVAKTVDVDVSTILDEQVKDPVYGTVRSWLRKVISPGNKITQNSTNQRTSLILPRVRPIPDRRRRTIAML